MELPEMSRKMDDFFRSAGEPLSDTEIRVRRRGVVTFRTPFELLSELAEETRLMLTRSAMPSCGIDKRWQSTSAEPALVPDILSVFPL